MIRSNYLVHWTGKNIGCSLDNLSEEQCNEYTERLRSILQDGLWMNTISENLYGGHPTQTVIGPASGVTYTVPAVCFTEIRLSQAKRHASKFGLLGIIFDRLFVLDRLGAPVWYIRNNQNERIFASFFHLVNYLHKLQENDAENSDAIENINFISTFFKGMSETTTDNFSFLDEHEWRIVFNNILLERGLAERNSTGKNPRYILRVPHNEVKLIVAPNTRIKEGIQKSKWFSTMFGQTTPSILTLEDCDSF